MGELLNIVTPVHQATSRDYLGRMTDAKVECMKIARRYDEQFWDGERQNNNSGLGVEVKRINLNRVT